MPLPPLELIDDAHLYISGEVLIDSSAAIAPGVLLQADPGCRLIIAAGVCIGQGSVLHAHQGDLLIEVGAILGTGVLVVGRGSIGANACIGSQTTILNSSVIANHSIPPQSLIGDLSRSVDLEMAGREMAGRETAGQETANQDAEKSVASASSIPPEQPVPLSAPPSNPPDRASGLLSATKSLTQVYGQAYVERIMITMFPHRKALESSLDASPPSPPRDPPA